MDQAMETNLTAEDIISRVIRSRRRTLALQVTPDASLIVRAPFRASEEYIRRLVKRKMPWIIKRQRMAREAFLSRPRHAFLEGETFLFQGEPRRLCLAPEGSPPLTYSEGRFLLAKPHVPSARQIFEKWYRSQALSIIKERIRPYAARAGLAYSKIAVTGARRRWGSCSSKGNLNFSWRLVMAPPEIMDYVIVHELAHIAVPNHSARFWQKVGTLFPDHRRARLWLNKNHAAMDL